MLKLHHEHHRDTKGFRINKDNDTANKYVSPSWTVHNIFRCMEWHGTKIRIFSHWAQKHLLPLKTLSSHPQMKLSTVNFSVLWTGKCNFYFKNYTFSLISSRRGHATRWKTPVIKVCLNVFLPLNKNQRMHIFSLIFSKKQNLLSLYHFN